MNKEELVEGAIYEVTALNFAIAVWTGRDFKGPKLEYGKVSFYREKAYWEGLPLGTASPVRRIGSLTVKKPYDGINLLAALEAANILILERERSLL